MVTRTKEPDIQSSEMLIKVEMERKMKQEEEKRKKVKCSVAFAFYLGNFFGLISQG